MVDLLSHYQIYINGNKLYRNYKSAASAKKRFEILSAKGDYIELWYTDSVGARYLVAYDN